MKDQDFRFEFDPDGTLHQRGRDGFKEPLCAVCMEPIRYCLDMFSFTTGHDQALAHARCVWKKEAFDDQRRLAPSDETGDESSALEDLDVGYESRWHEHHTEYEDACADCRRERHRDLR